MAQRIYSTLSGKKETFEPIEPGKVSMYVCGVTVYDLCHVGHARCYVAFDVIHRWLKRHYEVKYVRNFTDVDDKIIRRANESGEDPVALAARYADEFHVDMGKLGVGKADVEPRVSTHIDEIITFVKTLVGKGAAYTVPADTTVEGAKEDVYYAVEKFPNYTALSGRNLDDMIAGARVAVDERKRSPLDFALWKAAKPDEPFWDSPWGKGRPGWHIECSAMSACHLGESFDIHGGGKDLIFPHHTNEIAQSEACHDGAQMARYWVHNGFVNVVSSTKDPVSGADVDEKNPGATVTLDDVTYCFESEANAATFRQDPEKYQKMSKSLGNFFTIRDIFERNTPEALRWMLIGTHYRNPIGFSPALVDEAERRVQYLYETLRDVAGYLEANEGRDGDDLATTFSKEGAPFAPWDDLATYMEDDFGTPGAMSAFVEMLKVANLLIRGREKDEIGRKLKPADRARLLREWQEKLTPMREILGLGERDPEAFLAEQRGLRCRLRGIEPAAVEALIEQRKAARAAKDFAAADKVRDELAAMGVEVRDGVAGVEWSVL